MEQLTYILDEALSPEQMWRQVVTEPAYVQARTRLLVVLEPQENYGRIRGRIREGAKKLERVAVVGMTTMGSVAADVVVPTDTVCSFLLFSESEVHVDVFDCTQLTPREAGVEYCRRLDGYAHVRGILCIPAIANENPEPFVAELVSHGVDVPIFGAQAGIGDLSGGGSAVLAKGEVCKRAILTVTLCGEDLQVKPTYNLGWRAIGNDHVISSCDDGGRVFTIDGKPAVSIYQHYLKVPLDGNFFDNACPFPLVVRSGEELVARVPISYSEDGSLLFPSSFEPGAHAYLSYAHPNDLIRETTVSANEMAAFQPEALLLFACVNRRVFLGNARADYEVECYRHACPSMAWGYGNGEIMHTKDGGGLLNSTIVALGMREGEPRHEAPEPLADPIVILDRPTPLSERLATFLDAATAEFNATISELEVMAKRDSLTGAFNRRRMDEILHYEMAKRRRENDLVLLMYDIDWFKSINDTYGHDTGDIVLKDLTRCVQSCIREGDTLGRWGGEEFVCLLTELTSEQAYEAAERIRRRVEQRTFLRVGHVTISIGITAAREGDTAETIFQRVDKALYDAKRAGRNCTRVR